MCAPIFPPLTTFPLSLHPRSHNSTPIASLASVGLLTLLLVLVVFATPASYAFESVLLAQPEALGLHIPEVSHLHALSPARGTHADELEALARLDVPWCMAVCAVLARVHDVRAQNIAFDVGDTHGCFCFEKDFDK